MGNTALGPIAFLACEAIGGAITISYGFSNAVWAIAAFSLLMFLIGLPIAYYAAKYGVDIDLLTRGAGFGYMGSTLTSLIYASFTFLLFAIEASILSMALQMLFDIPLAIAHLISSLVVIPIAIYGISLHQPRAAADAAGVADPAVRAAALYRVEVARRCHGVDAVRRQGRRRERQLRFPALRSGRVGAALAAPADRRAGGSTCASSQPRSARTAGMVDGAAGHRPRLDRAGRPEDPRRRLPRGLRASARRLRRTGAPADGDVFRRVPRGAAFADDGAGAGRACSSSSARSRST